MGKNRIWMPIAAGVAAVGIIVAVILIFFVKRADSDAIGTSGLPLPAISNTPEDSASGLPLPAISNTPEDSPKTPAPGFDPADAYASVIDSTYGVAGEYAFYDIDGNGTPELILHYETQMPMEEYAYIYTYVDGMAYEVGKFWSRSRLEAIDSDGVIYRVGSSGWANSVIVAHRISDDYKSLVTIESWEADYDEEVFAHTINGAESRITEQEFDRVSGRIYNEWGVLGDFAWMPLPSSLISTDDWIDVNGRIRIPPTWEYQIYSEDGMEWIIISGDGVDGPINMAVGYIIEMPFESVFDESLSFRKFVFDNGAEGYMFVFPESIAWVYEDSWWDGVMLYLDGVESIYSRNEAIIAAIAASLT